MRRLFLLTFVVVFLAIVGGAGCMSEAPVTEEINFTLSVDGHVVLSHAHTIDSAESEAFYAAKERDIASYATSLQGYQSATTQIEIAVNGAERTSEWSFAVPAQDANDALLKLTAVLTNDTAESVEHNAPTTLVAPAGDCCITCNGITACGCAVTYCGGSCCVGECCR